MRNIPWQTRLAAARRMKELEAKANTISYTPGTDFATAPGWRELGMEISCVPDATYPWDKAAVKAIKAIDSSFVPIWIRWVFMSPSETGNPQPTVFGRHGLARIVSDPHGYKQPLNALMPLGYKGPPPNQIEVIFMGKRNPKYPDLPGEYVPLGWNIYKFVQENYGQKSVRDLKQTLIVEAKAEWERGKAKRAEELEYVQRDVQRYAQRQLDKVSELEVRDHLLGKR